MMVEDDRLYFAMRFKKNWLHQDQQKLFIHCIAVPKKDCDEKQAVLKIYIYVLSHKKKLYENTSDLLYSQVGDKSMNISTLPLHLK